MKIERILVALDASPHSIAALDAAAGLAVMHQAELVGLFVEDIDLLNLAELPFSREIIYPQALGRRIEVPLMTARLKELAEEARKAISESALRAGVEWMFLVRRGGVLTELLKEVDRCDLLVLGKASHVEKRRRVRLGTTAADLLARSSRPVLVLQHGEVCRGPAILLYDGSAGTRASLPAAFEVGKMFEGTPVVLLLAKEREEAETMKRQIGEKLGEEEVRFRRCSPLEHGGLVRIAHEEEAGVVILVGPLSVPPEELPEMLDRLDRPVLAFR